MAGRQIVASIVTAGLVSALVTGTAGIPVFRTDRAEASCITWQGGQTCDSPAPQRSFHYQAPSRGYRGGYRSYGGGGGGNAAAALGAASAAIGILGMMIEAAEQQRNAANEAQRQAYNACQARYRQAHAINEQARKIAANGDAEEAYGEFERALNVLGNCGTRTDLAKLRGNLDNMRREYAKLTTPSADWSPDDRTNAPKKAMIYPGALDDQANKACNFATAGSNAWQACAARTKADAILATDPDIRAACQSLADTEARNQCVFNRYWAGMQGKDPNQFGDPSNCYWDEHGKPCHGGATARRSPSRDANSDPNSLRNQLRRALAEKAKQNDAAADARAAEIARAKAVRDSLPEGSEDRKTLDAVIAKAEAGQVPAGGAPSGGNEPANAAPQSGEQQTAAVSSEPSAGAGGSSNDDAYSNYMNSSNSSTGTRNDGNLNRQDGFSMSGSETDKEIGRLTGN